MIDKVLKSLRRDDTGDFSFSRQFLYRQLQTSYQKTGAWELIVFENEKDLRSWILSRSSTESGIKKSPKTENVFLERIAMLWAGGLKFLLFTQQPSTSVGQSEYSISNIYNWRQLRHSTSRVDGHLL